MNEELKKIVIIMDRESKKLIAASKMQHATYNDVSAKLEALKKIYYRMLLQQSKMELLASGKGLKLEQYYKNIEEELEE